MCIRDRPNGVGNPDFQTICLKGISEVAHIYGKGRVQTPLKRVGERGSGQLEPISWDQALDEISDLIKKTQDAQMCIRDRPWRALRVPEERQLRVHGNVRGRGSRKACGDVLG